MVRSIMALLIIVSAAVTLVSQGSREEPVWFWFATCGGPLMTLEVQADNRIVHKSTFPLCRANREAVQSQGQAGRIEFTWRPNRVVVWEGYREAEDRSAANQVLEGNIWQAGAEPGTMTFGVSFVSGKRNRHEYHSRGASGCARRIDHRQGPGCSDLPGDEMMARIFHI